MPVADVARRPGRGAPLIAIRPYDAARRSLAFLAPVSDGCRPPPPAPPTPAPGNPVVVISTSLGDITVELFKDRAPVSVENFLQYVDGRLLRRDHLPPRDAWIHDPRRWIHADDGREADAAADPERSDQRPEQHPRHAGDGADRRRCAARPRSSTSTSRTTAQLDHHGYSPDDFGYAVFGRVLSGMEVVDRIAAVANAHRRAARGRAGRACRHQGRHA